MNRLAALDGLAVVDDEVLDVEDAERLGAGRVLGAPVLAVLARPWAMSVWALAVKSHSAPSGGGGTSRSRPRGGRPPPGDRS